MRASIAHLPEITYPIVFLAVLAAQLCVPIPAILFLAAAGTLAALGKLNLLLIITGATVGCLIGDYAWFLAGRRIGTRALRIFGLFSSDRRSLVKNTKQAFNRWGRISVPDRQVCSGSRWYASAFGRHTAATALGFFSL